MYVCEIKKQDSNNLLIIIIAIIFMQGPTISSTLFAFMNIIAISYNESIRNLA